MSESEDQKKSELEELQGADRLEKAVALHIHAINTPVMILEGYLPEQPGEPLSEKALEKIKRSLDKIKNFTGELKSELIQYRTDK
ncbi:MAG: hypothetical protein HRT45_15405 [Bdellovibrionales bacterium]|nr:hypothetical protein [Bdellovibrionales bacterium]